MQTLKQERASRRNYSIYQLKGMRNQLQGIHMNNYSTSREKILIKSCLRYINLLLDEIRSANANNSKDSNNTDKA